VSVQFGRWNFDGKPVNPDYMEKVKPFIALYGPDGGSSYSKGNASILYHAFHTTKESQRELQPHVLASGAVITWDGRLDNRAELVRELRDVVTLDSTDVSIVAAAYEEWDTNCFARLIGDWAVSIWDASAHSLLLAKDPIGIRQLYYALNNDHVAWSTILDPLIILSGKTFALCEEYIAGWLSFFPATHLTPYVGIHSVPPSSCVLIRAGMNTVRKYWDFDPGKQIRYPTDAEYEEHFRSVFAEAVRHRLRSDNPVLAELSGGMDSSSIVCMADAIIARGAAETPRLDTLSYYDRSEPNWDEQPYFTKVEEKRRQAGCHIELSSRNMFSFIFAETKFVTSPSGIGCATDTTNQFETGMSARKNRVILSGIGGDEVLGGVPSPLPRLADLIARAQIKSFVHELVAWAIAMKKPLLYLLFDLFRAFSPTSLGGIPRYKRPVSWLRPDFIKRNLTALHGYEAQLHLFGHLPSFQDNVNTLDNLRRQLSCAPPQSAPVHEKRYPYLDRQLLEFLWAIPRDQIVRPGQRRSLMRRALRGIVPDEILNRKRKAFVAKGPQASISNLSFRLSAWSDHMLSDSLGIVDRVIIRKTFESALDGQQMPLVPLLRICALEVWLQCLQEKCFLSPETKEALSRTVPAAAADPVICPPLSFSAENTHKERR
jgi:asparagine synthase (glutamine-hydrolysing)